MSWTLKFQATALEVKAWSALKFDVVAEIDDEGDLKEQLKDIFDEAMDEEYERGKLEAEEECECEECDDEKEIDDFDLDEIIDHLNGAAFSKRETAQLRGFCTKFLEETK